MHLSIDRICYGGSEACPKFDMLLIGAKFSQQHSADHNEKKKTWKDDSGESKDSATELLNKNGAMFHVAFLAVPLHA